MTPAQAIAQLLAERGPDKSFCPTEIAKRIAAQDWRAKLPAVHAEVARQHDAGVVRLTWKGAPRQPGDGPYRIRRA